MHRCSDRPIEYATRTLNESEINYSVMEKKLLTNTWVTKYFLPYLFSRKFKFYFENSNGSYKKGNLN